MAVQKKIPLYQPSLSISEKKNVVNCINENWISSKGKFVKKFEYNFKKKFNYRYSTVTTNGTTALHLAVMSLNLNRGDEVIVPNYTMVATANVVKMAGLKLNLVDISEKDLCMCPKDLAKKITKKTKVVIYTQMNGRVGQIDKIAKICKKRNIFLIEDAAHAIGSYIKNKHVGNHGIASSFSFSKST